MVVKSLPVVSVGGEVYAKFNACVHCGLCLPACPTYVETGNEADSPRGRIHLMKAVVDGRAGASDVAFEHLDRCLVCRACETACPSGVQYHDLIEAVRPKIAAEALGGRRMRSRMLQWVIGHVLPYPKRVAASLLPLKMAQGIGLGGLVDRWLPGAGALAMTGRSKNGTQEIAAFTPAVGKCRGQVILLRGCVGSVLSAGINVASVRVLSRNGFDVHILADEPCCGALAAHANDPEGAESRAALLVERLAERDVDAIVSPIAGCGAQLKALDKVLAGTAQGEKAKGVVRRMRDICEFLREAGIDAPKGRIERSVTYHDPCHLAHAQRITEAPRQLLAMVPGLKVVPLAESDMCCGAAGTYNLNQPEMAERLGERKVRHIEATQAQEVVTANIGCALQIARHLKERGMKVGVRHVVEVLAEAYQAK